MDTNRFEQLVQQALERLPPEFKDKMSNVAIVVEPLPNAAQLKRLKLRSPLNLLGLYEGVPLTHRGQGYTLTLPDKITLFQKSIEARCGSREDIIIAEIEAVLKHEIAHHFGIGDKRLQSPEIEKRKRQSSS